MQKFFLLSCLLVVDSCMQAYPIRSLWASVVGCCKRPERRVIAKKISKNDVVKAEDALQIALQGFQDELSNRVKTNKQLSSLEKQLGQKDIDELMLEIQKFYTLHHPSYDPTLLKNALEGQASADDALDVMVKNEPVREAMQTWFNHLEASGMTYTYSPKTGASRLVSKDSRVRGLSVDVNDFLDTHTKSRSPSE